MAHGKRKTEQRAAKEREGWNLHGWVHSFIGFDFATYYATRHRQFLTLSMPIRVIVILLPLIILYITALYIKDLWIHRQSAAGTNPHRSIGPPQLWLFDTTTPYHITTDINNFCSYHSFGPLMQSSLPPLALPLKHSSPSPSTSGRGSASRLTSDEVSESPSPDNNGNNRGGLVTGRPDENTPHPFTLHHHGHPVLGYGTVRLRIFSGPYDWQTEDRFRTEPSSYKTVLTNVLHVPTVPEQVISVSKLLSDDTHDARGYIEHSRTDTNELSLKYHGNPEFHAWARGGAYVLEAKSWVSDQGDCNITFTDRPKFAV